MASNPMQQFSVHKIGPEIKIAGIDLSFTNASLFMVISASVILLFMFLGTKEKKIIPNNIPTKLPKNIPLTLVHLSCTSTAPFIPNKATKNAINTGFKF